MVLDVAKLWRVLSFCGASYDFVHIELARSTTPVVLIMVRGRLESGTDCHRLRAAKVVFEESLWEYTSCLAPQET